MFNPSGITILDSTMRKDDIRIIKSINEILGFKITNEIGQHLFIEIKWDSNLPGRIEELIIRTGP